MYNRIPYQYVQGILRALFILPDGWEHRQDQTGEHQQEPEREKNSLVSLGL